MLMLGETYGNFKKCTNNRIIILTTHFMEEASTLGKRIGIMSDGKLQCCGSNLFLIKKYGKHICLNIIKKSNGNDTEIVDFIKGSVRGDIEVEILSEEIIIQLPLLNEHSYKQLFLNLDSNLDKLNIITYGISMPTLKDVFLNLSSAKNPLHKKGIEDNIDSFDKYDSKLEEKPNCLSKFFTDLTSLLKARLIHSFRDKKAFTLEVLCPLLLVLISLLVSSGSSKTPIGKLYPSFLVHPSIIDKVTNVYINTNDQIFLPDESVNYNIIQYKDPSTNINTFIEFKKNFPTKTTIPSEMDSFGSYYLIQADRKKNLYEFISYANMFYTQSIIIYPQFIMNNIISSVAEKKIDIKCTNLPFPQLYSSLNDMDEIKKQMIPFLISMAFSMIAANMITMIIKEREQNTKHLQIISGLSYFSYWVSSYLF
jgi:ATP-binding cassette subfamily A (ABC1) protein 3